MRKTIYKLRQIINNENGSMVIEVSIAIIIISALFLGFVMFTSSMRYHLVMSMAAREGAREYAVTKSIDKANHKIEGELLLGGIDNANIIIDDGEIIIEKPIAFYVPSTGRYRLNLKTGAKFHKEDELFFYSDVR